MRRLLERLVPLLVLFAAGAQAQTVQVGLSPSAGGPLNIGESLAIEIVGVYSGPDTLGSGAIGVGFDADILQLDSVSINANFFSLNNETAVGNVPALSIDNDLGQVDVIGFSAFVLNPPAPETVTLATLSFTATSPGLASITLEDATNAFFAWETNALSPLDVVPSFDGGTLQAVPLPAATWLLLSGLALLATRRRGIDSQALSP